MTKFTEYLIREENKLTGYLMFLEYDQEINEMSDESFQSIKKLGDRMGVKVSKSHTLFSLLKRFSSDVGRVIGLATRFHFAKITNNPKKASKLKIELDKALTKTTKKDVMSFFLQLDKNLLSLTSIPRHILQSFFGVEISTYNQWKEDKDYILDSLEKIRKVLQKMDGEHDKEMKMLVNLEKSIKEMGL